MLEHSLELEVINKDMHQSLERFIEQNREAFDSHFPSPDLWNRIAEKSPEVKLAVRRQPVLFFKRIAAAVVILITVSIGWQMFFAKSPIKDEHMAQFTPLDQEVKEAAFFYEQEIQRKSNEVFELTSNQPEIREGVEMDLAELDEVLVQLKNDLKDNVDNAEVLAAMIQNYRLKLDILEQILSFVEQKEANNENIVLYEL